MTDEPDTAELENRIDTLESKIEKMMPSRRDALKMGGAALAGGSLMAGTASAGSDQVGTIGSPSKPVDLESEDINNADTVTTENLVVNQSATLPDAGGSAKVGTKIFDSVRTTYSLNTAKEIPFDTVAYDFDSGADLANNRIAAPKDATYTMVFGFAARGDIAANSDVIVRNRVNSSDVGSMPVQVAKSDFLKETFVYKHELSAGDTVSIELEYREGGSSFTGNDGEHNMFLALTPDA